MRLPCLAAVILLLICSLRASGQNETPAASELPPERIIDCHGTLVRFLEGQPYPFRGEIVLPEPLPGHGRYRLRITMANQTQSEFDFDEVLVSCGCGKGRFKQERVYHGGRLEGEVDLTVPTAVREEKITLYFRQKGELLGEVAIRLNVEGHLSLDNSWHELRFAGELGEWSLHGTYSLPVRFERLELDKAPAFRGYEMRLADAGRPGEFFVVISAPAAVVGPGGASGYLTVRDPEQKTEYTVQVNIRRAMPYTFSPLLLRFRRLETDSETLVASALVSSNPVDPAVNSPDGRGARQEPAEANAAGKPARPPFEAILASREMREEVEGKVVTRREPADVRAREIAPGIHRLEIRLPSRSLDGQKHELDWSFSLGGQDYSVTTPFLVEGD